MTISNQFMFITYLLEIQVMGLFIMNSFIRVKLTCHFRLMTTVNSVNCYLHDPLTFQHSARSRNDTNQTNRVLTARAKGS